MFKELIWVKKNSLSKTFCNNVIEKFEDEQKKRPGKIGGVPPDYNGRVDKSVKDTTDLLITKVSGWEEEDGIFYKALQEAYSSNPELIERYTASGAYLLSSCDTAAEREEIWKKAKGDK